MRPVSSVSVVAGSLLALALVHCGGDSGGGSANLDSFLGSWSCESTTTVTVTKPSGMPEKMSTTTVTLEVKKSGTNAVTIGEEGDPTCAAELRVAGNTGTLVSSLTCDQGGQSFKIQSAKVTVSGNKLKGSRTAALSGTSDTGDALSGTVTTSIDCTRLSGPSDADAGGLGNGGKTGSGGSPGTGAKTGTGAAMGTGATGTGGGGSNVDCTTAQDCGTCCDDNFPDGIDRLQTLLIDCACQACSTECATSLCDAANPAEPSPGDACDTCARMALADGSACITDVANSCAKDSACVPYARCVGSCP
jgi:hypothetical protein